MGAACLLPRPGAAPASGASGPAVDPRPARAACQAEPFRWGGYAWFSGGGSSSSSNTLGTVGSKAGHGAPLEAFHLVGLFQKDLTQDDPHWGVSLDGEAQCFQGPKGRVHFPFGYALVEGADLEVAIRAPRIP